MDSNNKSRWLVIAGGVVAIIAVVLVWLLSNGNRWDAVVNAMN